MNIARLLRRLLVAGLFLVLATAVTGKWLLERPLTVPNEPWDFEVKAGATLAAVARDLAGEGVIPHPLALVALGRWKRADRAIKAGNYELHSGITLPQLLSKLTQGDVTQTSVTVVEGATFADFARTLRDSRDVAKSVLDLPQADLLAKLGIDAVHPEGQFFPDTYFFAAGASDAALLKRAHRLLAERLDAAWARRAPGVPLATPYEALILASIVEKETGRAADRPLVASVFANRLRKGMKLQSDPTVIYGMGAAFDGNLRRRDLEADTPYNTYTREGLPPTPIALPSQASLDAVVDPPATDYLYFVARGDGSSEFTTNLADHNRAVARYQLKKGMR
jgi:UPF0755 protein